jgi:hypothetical protein
VVSDSRLNQEIKKMNNRLITLLMVLFALSSLAQAAGNAATDVSAQRAAFLQSATLGATVTSDSLKYQLLPGARAVKSRSQELPQQTLARVGGGKVIETKGSFVVFTATQQGGASITQVNGATAYPTVLNSSTGAIGILPGTLNARLKNMANAAAVATDHGLELVREFAHMKTVFYRVKSGQDVVAAAASLAADARVSSAEVEVIENVNTPN